MRFCGRRLKPLELTAFSTSLYGKNCFKYRATMLWNNLEILIKPAEILMTLRNVYRTLRDPYAAVFIVSYVF